MQAMARNCRNQSLRCQGRSPSGENREARVPMRSTGADRFVGAMKARNGAGAKGSGQAVVRVDHNWQQEDGDAYDQTSRSISIRSKCTKPTKRSNPMAVPLVWMVRRSSSSKPT